MRRRIAVLAVALSLPLAPAAHAAGCLKGAVVGGLAGHAVHHGVLGAVGGCAVGHHLAHKKAKQAPQAQQNPNTDQHTSRSD